jgi:Holliday junction resolvasome RuvABC endonuclease subunit
MRIIALDIATKTGWAVINEDGIIEDSGVEKFTGETRGEKLSSCMAFFFFLFKAHNPSCIVAEKPFFRGSGTRLLMPMVGLAELSAHRNNAAFLEVPAVTVKQYLTGNGKAEKSQMMAEITKLGYSFEDDNEADAIAMALYAYPNIE